MPSEAQCQCKDDSVIICSLQDVMQFKIYINIFRIIRTRCLDAREKKGCRSRQATPRAEVVSSV